jgi:hypothetical protein
MTGEEPSIFPIRFWDTLLLSVSTKSMYRFYLYIVIGLRFRVWDRHRFYGYPGERYIPQIFQMLN